MTSSPLSSPLSLTPELAHTNGGLETEKTLRLRLAELEAEYADVKRRLCHLRPELDVEQPEPNAQDSDTTDEQGMSALWVAQTALTEMRLRYEEQRAGRREAERKCAHLNSVVKQMEAASRVMTTSLQEIAAESESQAGEVDAAVTISLELRKELVCTRAKLEESNDNLRTAAAEISTLKIALEKMNTKLVESRIKFEELADEVQTVREALNVVFDEAEETKAINSDLELVCSILNILELLPYRNATKFHLPLTSIKKMAALQTTLQEREEELALTQADRRLAHEELADANAIAGKLQKKLETQSAAASRMEKSNARLQKKHEELKHTCRELIALVEGLEAAGGTVGDALTRLHQKYKEVKSEQEELQAKLDKAEHKNSRLKTALKAMRVATCTTEDGGDG